jgi:hypothetical protein
MADDYSPEDFAGNDDSNIDKRIPDGSTPSVIGPKLSLAQSEGSTSELYHATKLAPQQQAPASAVPVGPGTDYGVVGGIKEVQSLREKEAAQRAAALAAGNAQGDALIQQSNRVAADADAALGRSSEINSAEQANLADRRNRQANIERMDKEIYRRSMAKGDLYANPAQAAATIAAALSPLFSNTPESGVKMYNDYVAREMDKQQERIDALGTKRMGAVNALDRYTKLYGDERLARVAMSKAYDDAASEKLKALSMRFQGEDKKNQALEMATRFDTSSQVKSMQLNAALHRGAQFVPAALAMYADPAAGSNAIYPVQTKTEASKYDTPLSPQQEKLYMAWKNTVAPNDSGEDYDFRGAFKAGIRKPKGGHWPDTFKKPNHPTFSNESKYADDTAGKWIGETFVPAGQEPRLLKDTTDKDMSATPSPAPFSPAGSGPEQGFPSGPDMVANNPVTSGLSSGLNRLTEYAANLRGQSGVSAQTGVAPAASPQASNYNPTPGKPIPPPKDEIGPEKPARSPGDAVMGKTLKRIYDDSNTVTWAQRDPNEVREIASEITKDKIKIAEWVRQRDIGTKEQKAEYANILSNAAQEAYISAVNKRILELSNNQSKVKDPRGLIAQAHQMAKSDYSTAISKLSENNGAVDKEFSEENYPARVAQMKELFEAIDGIKSVAAEQGKPVNDVIGKPLLILGALKSSEWQEKIRAARAASAAAGLGDNPVAKKEREATDKLLTALVNISNMKLGESAGKSMTTSEIRNHEKGMPRMDDFKKMEDYANTYEDLLVKKQVAIAKEGVRKALAANKPGTGSDQKEVDNLTTLALAKYFQSSNSMDLERQRIQRLGRLKPGKN